MNLKPVILKLSKLFLQKKTILSQGSCKAVNLNLEPQNFRFQISSFRFQVSNFKFPLTLLILIANTGAAQPFLKLRNYSTLLCWIFAIAMLIGCSSAHVKKRKSIPNPNTVAAHPGQLSTAGDLIYNSDELKYFLEITLGSEYGMGDFTIKKWADNIKVEIMGQPTREDLQVVDQVVEELNSLIGPGLNMQVTPQNGNVKIYFVPHNQFYRYEPSGIIFYGGFFWDWWNYAGEITKGRVVIGSDRVAQSQRRHLIREELTQVLGLMNDSMKYPQSIFYQAPSETTNYSDLDRKLIKLLYSQQIVPGMTGFEIQDVLLRRGTR